MAGVFDQTTISRVQQANDIIDVVAEHVSLVKKGTEMVGVCPFHDDHSPSMYVSSVKQIFKCFACGAGGDVFKFVQMRENLSFGQAIERLANRAGIDVKPQHSARSDHGENGEHVDPNSLAKVNEWAAKYFHSVLNDKEKGKFARDYLAERNINADSIKKWRIGLAPAGRTDLIDAATQRKISTKLLSQAGLVVGTQGQGGLADKFVNRLMFTITDVTGRVIGFGGRQLDATGAKYVNSPSTALFDKSNSIYGLEQARHEIVSAKTAVVVEGYTDCIMAHQFGCCNVVATLGTSFASGHGRLLRRYVKNVVLIFDSDTAGIEAANRALGVCLEQGIDIKVATVPKGKDPCEYLQEEGKEGLDKLIAEAADVFEYKWARLNSQLNSEQTIAGKSKAVDEFLQTVASALKNGNLSPIDKGLVVNRLSVLIGLTSTQINTELAKKLKNTGRTASFHHENRKVVNTSLPTNLASLAQQELLEVLINEPKLFENARDCISAEEFEEPALKEIAIILFDILKTSQQVSLTQILSRVESIEVSNIITALAYSGHAKGNYQKRLADAKSNFQRLKMKKEIEQLRVVSDGSEIFRNVCENTKKINPYNLGMR